MISVVGQATRHANHTGSGSSRGSSFRSSVIASYHGEILPGLLGAGAGNQGTAVAHVPINEDPVIHETRQ